MTNQSRYPSFNVMNEKDEWDDHTQTIVTSRLKPSKSLHFLTPNEADMVKQISSLFVNDRSPEVLDFVLGHIDQTMHQSPGESQRKEGVPQAQELIRAGLQAIEQGVQSQYSSSFADLDRAKQKQYLQHISESVAKPQEIWNGIPQEALFRKLLNLTVESYCSHPKVWSEIGYAGPAYPRGYVRTQLGQLDPWEAQPEQ
ncbi:gluconate 2-dehydrogenase subunit 3 family protein [Paenibacillus filicis]|uniref:Gluconate 2-dehydrogenase subunit 3 family protein n=1 Tax=Paenibacillus gyeongsangnamensis TaxID=3388067 RepID=A0ABT4Q893_9BACL|nr:gluconate 2-dehydrogenase subunit 3 family protein [Paenibacillus filicis]MCZ8513044.1 gluconate 2-dehydrogenase subunit 3 family protein [Paenibacillus filicis]